MHARRGQQIFSPESLAEVLQDLPAASRYWVAYSGGCDSHVLVHAVAQLIRRGATGSSFQAVHVDHGLQAKSTEWARHCTAVCVQLEIPLTLLRIDARAGSGDSPEAAARHARYQALAGLMKPGDCLLTAHHQDDQAETLLLQLLRGGGPHGLAAMPAVSTFAAGLHARPLLAFSRDELRRYAQGLNLRWIDDPSNADSGFDRNYLRNRVVPVLRERWPAAMRVIARGAGHQAEAARLLDVMAAEDIRHCASGKQTLRISALLKLDALRQRNMMRFWLKNLGFKTPDKVRLDQVQQEVLQAAPDRLPEVHWDGVIIRRYRDELHALAPETSVDVNTVLPWSLENTLPLPDGSTLAAVARRGSGVKKISCRRGAVTVRYRRGGETCRIAPRGATHSLKNLLQEAGIPPWERGRIPLIYVDGQLAAVTGYWVCAPFHADEDDEGLVFERQYAVGDSA